MLKYSSFYRKFYQRINPQGENNGGLGKIKSQIQVLEESELATSLTHFKNEDRQP